MRAVTLAVALAGLCGGSVPVNAAWPKKLGNLKKMFQRKAGTTTETATARPTNVAEMQERLLWNTIREKYDLPTYDDMKALPPNEQYALRSKRINGNGTVEEALSSWKRNDVAAGVPNGIDDQLLGLQSVKMTVELNNLPPKHKEKDRIVFFAEYGRNKPMWEIVSDQKESIRLYKNYGLQEQKKYFSPQKIKDALISSDVAKQILDFYTTMEAGGLNVSQYVDLRRKLDYEVSKIIHRPIYEFSGGRL